MGLLQQRKTIKVLHPRRNGLLPRANEILRHESVAPNSNAQLPTE
jgi:hypothetical protein